MDNFVVSARKYRPATFESVVGQNHITSTLRNAISRSQLAHAYLFCGPRGVGKTTCARIFAKAINCLAPVDNEACNECESCRSFNDGRSFTIHELDAASNNSVDDIRSLTDQVRIAPQVGRYSVYIIDEVHMLSSAAFNAFLKTLEEPPVHAIFILATTEKHKILPTILSRCQIFDFNRIKVDDVVGYLKYIEGKEGITSDDESLNLIAAKADGGMRDALSMFDKAVSFCGKELNFKEVAKTLNVLDYDTYFDLTKIVLEGAYPEALMLFDDVLSKGFSPQTFIGGLNGHFRDLLMCKDPKTTPLLEVTGSLLEKYKKQSAVCDTRMLFESIALLTTLDGTLRTATSQRLNVELGLMKLCGLGQKKNELTTDVTSTPALPELTKRTAEVTPLVNKELEQKPEQMQPKAESQPEVRVETNSMVQTISGISIAQLLKPKSIEGGDESDTDREVEVEENIDPLSETKILKFKDRFVSGLKGNRPRIAMAFYEMRVEGNVVSVEVSNEQLYEEIMRSRTEILTGLVAVSGVNGGLDLVVTLVEDDPSARKPIKVEDKLKYFTDKNPALTNLRKALDLEIE